MKVSVQKIARLLEIAARKRNESDEATCSIARMFDGPDGDLSDRTFGRICDAVLELASLSAEKKPDFRRAARSLLARTGGRSKRA